MPPLFPNETSQYRETRNRLLAAERDLRRQVEVVAAMRRELPLGGPVPEDYLFEDGAGHFIRLSELLRDGLNTLLVYSFMSAHT